mmetsp:Transcript_16709/g.32954  ORF Transcript_16709/g.32954 Transcript_16709/m.32954 type:complete len:235 (+) Transcript_16709:1269-1973(+)
MLHADVQPPEGFQTVGSRGREEARSMVWVWGMDLRLPASRPVAVVPGSSHMIEVDRKTANDQDNRDTAAKDKWFHESGLIPPRPGRPLCTLSAQIVAGRFLAADQSALHFGHRYPQAQDGLGALEKHSLPRHADAGHIYSINAPSTAAHSVAPESTIAPETWMCEVCGWRDYSAAEPLQPAVVRLLAQKAIALTNVDTALKRAVGRLRQPPHANEPPPKKRQQTGTQSSRKKKR